jgi:hypothetical protein
MIVLFEGLFETQECKNKGIGKPRNPARTQLQNRGLDYII